MRTFKQDPLDKRVVIIDFTGWLAGQGNVASAAWVVPAGITASDDITTASAAINYFEGGTNNTTYEVACTITTDETVARKKTQRFQLIIEENFD